MSFSVRHQGQCIFCLLCLVLLVFSCLVLSPLVNRAFALLYFLYHFIPRTSANLTLVYMYVHYWVMFYHLISGRRVVQLGILADGLKGCQLCCQPLSLNDCIGEKLYGLGGKLLVKCIPCGLINDVLIGTRHGHLKTTWDVNSKLASGNVYMSTFNLISSFGVNNCNEQKQRLPVCRC